jgi:hypothetical protein
MNRFNSLRNGFAVALTIAAALLLVAAAPAAAAPKWRIDAVSNTTAAPGGTFEYFVQVWNVGDEAMDGSEIHLHADLPAGFTPLGSSFERLIDSGKIGCALAADEADCVNSEPLPPHAANTTHYQTLTLKVAVDPGVTGDPLAAFRVSGGGAAAASTVDPVRIAASAPGFGIDAFDAQVTDEAGAAFTQAAAHPGDITTYLDLNSVTDSLRGPIYPAAPVKDIVADLPPGLVGNTSAFPQCNLDQLGNRNDGGLPRPLCPLESQVGSIVLRADFESILSDRVAIGPYALYSMEPPPGVAARFGFTVLGVVIVLDARLSQGGNYALSVVSHNVSEGLPLAGATTTFWGRPASPAHDGERACPGEPELSLGGPTCPGGEDVAFLRTPTSCSPSLDLGIHVSSWNEPGALDPFGSPDLGDPAWVSARSFTHEAPGYPSRPEEWGAPAGTTGCAKVPVKGKLSARPTSIDSETPSGLDVHVEVPNPGLESPQGIATSDLKAVQVSLPSGVTINPSQAEGLGACTPARYASTELSFHPAPGSGCPDDSKIGTVEVKTPLLRETIPGDVFIATPDDPSTTQPGAENPFDSFLAIYIVLHEPQRGILVKLPGEIRTDPKTGQIVAEFRDLPQVPFSTFDFHFREGARAPLVTPPSCGTYTTEALLTPWSEPSHRIESDSTFEIVHGIGGGPCPPGGVPPFHPGFSAGSINNNAGSFSAFDMRLTRQDGEQDMTRFSSILPPGELGKLAGVAKCPDAAIAAAGRKTGKQELASPSCPSGSQIGTLKAGAGVGSVITYVGGKVYLGGPFGGDPLSVIAVTPAVVGPFDAGTIVVREALTLNPKTAEVEVDGRSSDPIPHILKGIPLKVRDLRVYVDRHEFTLNPTSCDPSSAKATLFGAYLDVFSSADDVPVSLANRYQAANCSSLGFKPGLGLHLRGGTARGGHPALVAAYKPRTGDANAKGLTVRLPRSAFLDQSHIRTICTRVQFAAKSCPPAAQYGYIKAFTPLLEEPLEGPVWLRSSNHKLPDLVFDLHGLVDIEVATRIDSIHGGVRASVGDIPDAPLSKVVLKMQGAKKGLIVNSRNLCGSTNKANAQFEGQNGKEASLDPVMRADCGKARHGKHGRHRR